LRWSEAKLSRIETGISRISSDDLGKLLSMYGVATAEQERLSALAVQARQRAWWEPHSNVLLKGYEEFIGFEEAATAIETYEPQVVPGLLQTSEYAAAIFQVRGEGPASVAERVAVRLGRQFVLGRQPPLQFWAILDEAVFHRTIGSPAIMDQQIHRLIEAAGRPAVRLQVLPFAAGAHRALSGSFMILKFAAPPADPVVYSEGLTGGLLRHKTEDVEDYQASFASLSAQALDDDESIELMRSMIGRDSPQ
jgi:hypothetical protein